MHSIASHFFRAPCRREWHSPLGHQSFAHNISRRTKAPSRTCRAVVCAAQRTYYDILGVPATATEREIKSAFRKKALKLHPDVNKAPDAQQRFMEAKAAFETLADSSARAEYDRRVRIGFSGSSWGSSSSSSSSSRRQASAGGAGGSSSPQEDFYGLMERLRGLGVGVADWVTRMDLSVMSPGRIEDFLKDLGDELDKWSSSRPSSGKPKSLWEELEELGEEFVEFLEDSMGAKNEQQQQQQQQKGGGGGGGGSGYSTPYDDLDAWFDSKTGAGAGSSSSSSAARSQQQAPPPPTPPPPPKKSADEEIDEMLRALKNKMGR